MLDRRGILPPAFLGQHEGRALLLAVGLRRLGRLDRDTPGNKRSLDFGKRHSALAIAVCYGHVMALRAGLVKMAPPRPPFLYLQERQAAPNATRAVRSWR